MRAATPVTMLLVTLTLTGTGCGTTSERSGRLARDGLIAYDSDVANQVVGRDSAGVVTTGIDVYVMSPDGGHKRRLTHDGHDGEPRWSPDGRRIVFVHGGCRTTACSPATRSALWVMNAGASGQRRLTSGRDVDGDPRWSPDGRWIAFTRGTSCMDDGCKLDIWLIRPDGAAARQLTRDGRSAEPTWSPDGRKIAFVRLNTDDSRADLYVMDADGESAHNLTPNVRNAAVSDPAWSPNGHTIAFIPFGFGSDTLAFISPDGTHPKHFRARGGDEVSEPAWAPDGKSIVVESQQTLWVASFPPTKAKRVAFNGDNHSPDWQPLLQH
jgi:TolB protein